MKMCTPRRNRTYTTDQDALNTISLICLRSTVVLSILYIFAEIAVLCDWHRSIISLGSALLYLYGIFCNLYILRKTDRNYCIENFSSVQSLIRILLGFKWMLMELGTQILQLVKCSSSFLKGLFGSSCPTGPTERVTRIDGVQTPDQLQRASAKSLTKEKSNSEPLKETFCRSSHEHINTSRNLKYRIAMKTPELFKNKIYQTRRTLINAQDELFNDKVIMF